MSNLPAIHPNVHTTANGTPYLTECGVVCLSIPHVDLSGIQPFLDGFNPELEFKEYLADPVDLPPAEKLCKFAGQSCYMSFGPKRSWNKDAATYLTHIKDSGHGSVCEHANFSFLFYGISRSLTHELVRHRAGFAFSQVSQRFVDGKRLRFVERPEYVSDPMLHISFEAYIEEAAAEYNRVANRLLELQGAGDPLLSADGKTALRKKVNQSARECLPNATEAPIVVSANVRAWRHFVEMRASGGADIAIRNLALGVYRCLNRVAPILFDDYRVMKFSDGTEVLDTDYTKI